MTLTLRVSKPYLLCSRKHQFVVTNVRAVWGIEALDSYESLQGLECVNLAAREPLASLWVITEGNSAESV